MRSYTLAELAEQYTVSLRTVETWVASGELRAVNVSRDRTSRKPRLRVLQCDLDAFLAGRATDAAAVHQPRRKRARLDVEQFV
jgi:excisionase family DNA binding protein